MNSKKRNIIALAINSFIAVSSFVIMIKGVSKGASAGQVGESMVGLGYFKAYTIDTNVINGFIALMMATFNLYNLIEDKDELPRFLVVAQLVSTVGVTVTMMTVIFFLSPMQYMAFGGFIWLFLKDMFFFHFFNPVLSIVNFVILDKRYKLNKKEIMSGIITTVVYSFVYAYNVLISKKWSDFYGFTFGGKLYMAAVSVIVMYLVSLLFSFVLVKLNAKSSEENNG